MIENKHPVSVSFEPPPGGGAEAPWVGRALSAGPVEVRGKRILLVDDEAALRACVRMMLQLRDHEVTEASNGAEALKLFAIGEFDLVITDFEMPVMKGNKLAAGIKLLDPSVPILMLTGSEGTRRDVENPVDALLNKPFTVADLYRALEKLLSIRPERAQAAVVPGLENLGCDLCPTPSAALIPAQGSALGSGRRFHQER